MTARLAAACVALVALVSLLLVAVSAVTLRDALLDRVDRDLREAAGRAVRGPEQDDQPPGRRGGGWRGGDADLLQAPGTLVAVLGGRVSEGYVVRADGTSGELSAQALQAVAGVEPHQPPVTVDVPGHGEHRLLAVEYGAPGRARGVVAVALPTADVDAVVADAVLRQAGVALLAVLLAGFVGLAARKAPHRRAQPP